MKPVLVIFCILFSISSSAVEVLEVLGENIKFRTIKYEIPLKKKVSIYSKKIKGKKRRKLAIAQVISVEGKIYTAKVLKKKKKALIEEGLYVRISKKYRLDGKDSGASKKSKSQKSLAKHTLGLRVRPLGPITGYYDGEVELALKGSNRSFSLAVALLALESESKTVSGLGINGKYNLYFADRALQKGFYISSIFGFYRFTVEGKSSSGDILSVDVFGPYLSGVLGYQYNVGNYSFTLGGGAGFFVTPTSVESTTSAGKKTVLEIPLSGFAPTIEFSLGYLF